MQVPYNRSHTGSYVVQEWMNEYFSTHPIDCENYGNFHSPHPEGNTITDIYVTSFNNNFFIEYQIKTLHRYFSGVFNLIVVDNNDHLYPEVSKELLRLCCDNNVLYLKPPHNHYQEKQHFDSTMKLGTTLSWLFHNVVKVRRPKYFMFLDQDCMLFRPFSKFKWLDEKGMYGTVCRNLPKWNIHVVNCMFKFDFVKDLPLDFRASYKHALDTGGACYDILYADKNMNDYMLSHTGHRFFKEDTVSGDKPQHYEIIDHCWIHLCSSTHDQLAGEGQRKLDFFKGWLDRSLLG